MQEFCVFLHRSARARMWSPSLPVTVLTGIAASAGIVCIYKDIRGGPPFDRDIRADGKTVVVTGANTGIGKETAWEFAKRGAKVFMACRDMAKCETARRKIVMETQNKYVYCRPCDLASLRSVRQFVERFKSEEPHLHILVNNAAVMENQRKVTEDGFELHLGVNHLGHFLLTNLLLDTIKASEPSRVIVVSSQSHKKGKIHKEDLNLAKQENYDPAAGYNQSKLANVLFANELATRLLERRVSVAVVDPGLTDSYLTRNLPMSKSLTRFLIYPFFWPSMKTPRRAAHSVLHAALDRDVAGAKGDYFVGMEKAEPSKEAQDFEMSRWLWRVSEKWTKLDEHKVALANAATASRTS